LLADQASGFGDELDGILPVPSERGRPDLAQDRRDRTPGEPRLRGYLADQVVRNLR
jgi:hypothetical protein